MSTTYEDWENELAIDALVIVYNHLYLAGKSIRREPKPQIEPEIESVAWNSFEREIKQRVDEPEVKPGSAALSGSRLEMCDELFRRRCDLHLVCRCILSYARRIVETGCLDWKMGLEIATRALFRHNTDLQTEYVDWEAEEMDWETEDEDEERMIQRSNLVICNPIFMNW
jgi:hypothetical protein